MDIQDNDDFSNTLQDKIDKFQKIKPKCVNCGRKV